MDLNTLFNLASSKTYYSRSDAEVWAAINEAASTLFLEVMGERRAFFVKWDTTTVVLAVNTEEYTLPADCGELVRMRERAVSSGAAGLWFTMFPADVNDADYEDAQFAASLGAGMEGPVSPFEYFGPYLDMAGAQTAAQAQKFRIQPAVDVARQVELVYIAKFVEIAGQDSPKVLPNEADGVVLYDAVAALLGDNGDDPTAASNQAAKNRREFLKWVRNRQIQQVRQVKPYLDDLD